MDLQSFLRAKRGRTQELAKSLGVSPSLVAQWAGGKPIAIERCPAIEKATGGLVRRADLRPGDWQEIWPELAAQHQASSLVTTAPAATAAGEHPAGARARQQDVVDRIFHGSCARPSMHRDGKPR